MPEKKITAFERLNNSKTGTSAADAAAHHAKDRLKEGDFLQMIDLTDGELHSVRMVSNIYVTCHHWVPVKNKLGKTVQIMKPCLSFDPLTGAHDRKVDGKPVEDPYFAAAADLGIQTRYYYWVSVIDREIQEMKPAKLQPWTQKETDTGFKEKGSKSWTPMRVIRMPVTAVKSIALLEKQNTYTNKSGVSKAFPLNHVKFGRDIMIKCDPNESPGQMWSVMPSDNKGAVTKEEMGYLQWDLESVIRKVFENNVETVAAAKEEIGKHFARRKSRTHSYDTDQDSFDDDTVDVEVADGPPKGEEHVEYDLDDDEIANS